MEESASAQAIDLLNYWIDECVHTHRVCNDGAKKPLPKRILYLTSTHIYLQEGVGARHRYACLSHCWGSKGPSLRLTAETCKQLSAGILEQDLPKVFNQAVQLCRKLSIHYLWIDALCRLLLLRTSSEQMRLTPNRHPAGQPNRLGGCGYFYGHHL